MVSLPHVPALQSPYSRITGTHLRTRRFARWDDVLSSASNAD